MQRRTLITVGMITLGSLLLGYCTTTIGLGHSGQVLDATTKKPIAGALVALYQSGDELRIVPHGGRVGVCFHSALTMTDSEGHYAFPPWIAPKHYYKRTALVLVYKPGYLSGEIDSENYSDYLKDVRIAKAKKRDEEGRLDPIEYLAPDANTTKKPVKYGGVYETSRVRYLYEKSVREFSCDASKTLYPLYKAAYEEARHLAMTEKDQEYVRKICGQAIKKHLFDRNYNPYQKPPPPCDINDVPKAWRAWDSKVTALSSQE